MRGKLLEQATVVANGDTRAGLGKVELTAFDLPLFLAASIIRQHETRPADYPLFFSTLTNYDHQVVSWQTLEPAFTAEEMMTPLLAVKHVLLCHVLFGVEPSACDDVLLYELQVQVTCINPSLFTCGSPSFSLLDSEVSLHYCFQVQVLQNYIFTCSSVRVKPKVRETLP